MGPIQYRNTKKARIQRSKEIHLYDSMTLMLVEKHVFKQTWRLSHTEQVLNIDHVKHHHDVCRDHSLSLL